MSGKRGKKKRQAVRKGGCFRCSFLNSIEETEKGMPEKRTFLGSPRCRRRVVRLRASGRRQITWRSRLNLSYRTSSPFSLRQFGSAASFISAGEKKLLLEKVRTNGDAISFPRTRRSCDTGREDETAADVSKGALTSTSFSRARDTSCQGCCSLSLPNEARLNQTLNSG